MQIKLNFSFDLVGGGIAEIKYCILDDTFILFWMHDF